MASTMELLDMFSSAFAKKILNVFAKKDDIPKVMEGAERERDGKSGLVPMPQAGNEQKYLRGDGTWQSPKETDNFNVATQEQDGLLSAEDKKKIDGIMEADTNDIDKIIAGTFEGLGGTLKMKEEEELQQ